jgi:hypothetical protein
VEDLHGQTRTDVDGEAMALRYRQLHALGWWRAMKGNQWPDKNQTSEASGQKSETKLKND